MTNPAAERLRQYVEGKIAYLEQIDRTPFGEGGLCAFKSVQSYVEAVVNESEHLPDDDVLVDVDWYFSHPPTLREDGLQLFISIQSREPGLLVMARDKRGEVVLLRNGTRGQLRLLLRALGVEGEGE